MQGRFALEQCPQKFVTSAEWAAVEFAGLYEKGIPPVAGGALDQMNSFIHACRFIWAEQARWKNKLGILW